MADVAVAPAPLTDVTAEVAPSPNINTSPDDATQPAVDSTLPAVAEAKASPTKEIAHLHQDQTKDFSDVNTFRKAMLGSVAPASVVLTEITMNLLLDRIASLEHAVAHVRIRAPEEADPQTDPFHNLSALSQAVAVLDNKVYEHSKKIKILAFNVSGGDDGNDDEEEEKESDKPSMFVKQAEPVHIMHVPTTPVAASAPKTQTSPEKPARSKIELSDKMQGVVKLEKSKSVLINELNNETKEDPSVLAAEKEHASLRRRETESLGKLKAAAQAAAKVHIDAQKEAERKLAEEEKLKAMKETAGSQFSSALAEQKKQMAAQIAQMQVDMKERDRQMREETARRHAEADDAMRRIEEEAKEAKERALAAEKELKAKKDQALLDRLRERVKTSKENHDVNSAAMRALNAATARQKMSPAKREMAQKRWRKAMRSVLSPAAKMKRALGSMLNKKVDKGQTVMSRMEKAEKELKITNNKLHQLEKALLKMRKAENTMLVDEEKNKANIKSLARQSTKALKLFDELSMAILGTSVNVAVSSLNALAGTDHASPLIRDEPSHQDSVVKSLMHTGKSASDELAKLLAPLAFKLSRPTAEDFDALAVAGSIIELLRDHRVELRSFSHYNYLPDEEEKRVERHTGARRASYSDVGGVDVGAAAAASYLVEKFDEEDEEKGGVDSGLTIEELLRLELHRLVACQVATGGGGGEGKKIADMATFFQTEMDRLEALMKKGLGENNKKLEEIKKVFAELKDHREMLTGNKVFIREVDAKVGDIRGLLAMKAEKELVDGIGTKIGTVKEDLEIVRSKLGNSKDLAEGMNRLRHTIDTKADKDVMNKLVKTVKNGMKEDVDPALATRCLSCERARDTEDENEKVAQAHYYKQYLTTLALVKSPQQVNVEKYEKYEKEKYGGKGNYVGGGYSKPKSPHQSLGVSMRPKSAFAKTRSPSMGGGGGGRSKRGGERDIIKYGSSQPLHVTLFSNDRLGGGAPETPVSFAERTERGTLSPLGKEPQVVVQRNGTPQPIPKHRELYPSND